MTEIFKAKTVDEAKAFASQKFGVSPDNRAKVSSVKFS